LLEWRLGAFFWGDPVYLKGFTSVTHGDHVYLTVFTFSVTHMMFLNGLTSHNFVHRKFYISQQSTPTMREGKLTPKLTPYGPLESKHLVSTNYAWAVSADLANKLLTKTHVSELDIGRL